VEKDFSLLVRNDKGKRFPLKFIPVETGTGMTKKNMGMTRMGAVIIKKVCKR